MELIVSASCLSFAAIVFCLALPNLKLLLQILQGAPVHPKRSAREAAQTPPRKTPEPDELSTEASSEDGESSSASPCAMPACPLLATGPPEDLKGLVEKAEVGTDIRWDMLLELMKGCDGEATLETPADLPMYDRAELLAMRPQIPARDLGIRTEAMEVSPQAKARRAAPKPRATRPQFADRPWRRPVA